MTAQTRLAAVLFGSFVVWLPALNAFLRGDVGAGTVGLRWAGAVVLVWAALALLRTIVDGYLSTDTAGAGEGDPPRRRADDQAPADRTVVAAEEPVVSDASAG